MFFNGRMELTQVKIFILVVYYNENILPGRVIGH
jgi:hypothetical protein